jgi:hypothetical protein
VIFLSCKANSRVYDAKTGQGPQPTGTAASPKRLKKSCVSDSHSALGTQTANQANLGSEPRQPTKPFRVQNPDSQRSQSGLRTQKANQASLGSDPTQPTKPVWAQNPDSQPSQSGLRTQAGNQASLGSEPRQPIKQSLSLPQLVQ